MANGYPAFTDRNAHGICRFEADRECGPDRDYFTTPRADDEWFFGVRRNIKERLPLQ